MFWMRKKVVLAVPGKELPDGRVLIDNEYEEEVTNGTVTVNVQRCTIDKDLYKKVMAILSKNSTEEACPYWYMFVPTEELDNPLNMKIDDEEPSMANAPSSESEEPPTSAEETESTEVKSEEVHTEVSTDTITDAKTEAEPTEVKSEEAPASAEETKVKSEEAPVKKTSSTTKKTKTKKGA